MQSVVDGINEVDVVGGPGGREEIHGPEGWEGSIGEDAGGRAPSRGSVRDLVDLVVSSDIEDADFLVVPSNGGDGGIG